MPSKYMLICRHLLGTQLTQIKSYDLSICLFRKAAIRETGVLPVISSLGIRDLKNEPAIDL